jgi:hypothetical protein
MTRFSDMAEMARKRPMVSALVSAWVIRAQACQHAHYKRKPKKAKLLTRNKAWVLTLASIPKFSLLSEPTD